MASNNATATATVDATNKCNGSLNSPDLLEQPARKIIKQQPQQDYHLEPELQDGLSCNDLFKNGEGLTYKP